MFPALVYTRRPSFLPFLFSPLLAPSRFAHPHTPLVFTRATFSYHLILLVLCSSRHRPQCYTDFQIAGFAVDRQVRILRPDRRGRCVLRTCTILYKSFRTPPGLRPRTSAVADQAADQTADSPTAADQDPVGTDGAPDTRTHGPGHTVSYTNLAVQFPPSEASGFGGGAHTGVEEEGAPRWEGDKASTCLHPLWSTPLVDPTSVGET
jgi:hypothetical protein